MWWVLFFGRNSFFSKCKYALKSTNTRIDMIKKKRKAVEKFLKNDIADLLRTNFDSNAYGRAEGLYVEMTMTWCYDFVQECCTSIGPYLKVMHKESSPSKGGLKIDFKSDSECPKECRVAVSSLMYAAARFADLPELRDLRELFTGKYGTSLDSYVDREFVENLRASPPSMDTKLQLMRDIAEEYSVEWDSTALEETLCSSSATSPKATFKSEDVFLETQEELDNLDDDGTSAPEQLKNPSPEEQQQSRRRPFSNGAVPPPYKLDPPSSSEQLEQPLMMNGDDQQSVRSIRQAQSHIIRRERSLSEGEDVLSAAFEDALTNGNTNAGNPSYLNSSLPLPPARRRPVYFEDAQTINTGRVVAGGSRNRRQQHMRAFSLDSDRMLFEDFNNNNNDHNHQHPGTVHPKLPDCDDLPNRIQELSKLENS